MCCLALELLELKRGPTERTASEHAKDGRGHYKFITTYKPGDVVGRPWCREAGQGRAAGAAAGSVQGAEVPPHGSVSAHSSTFVSACQLEAWGAELGVDGEPDRHIWR